MIPKSVGKETDKTNYSGLCAEREKEKERERGKRKREKGERERVFFFLGFGSW